MAESLPLPTPFTITSIEAGQTDLSFSPMAAITLVEANGVAFFGPENPKDPEDAQTTTFPALSVTDTVVLL